MNAFIEAQHIFPPDAPCDGTDISDLTEDDLRQMRMAGTIKKKTRASMIEDVSGR